jgi:hypothetical protein
MSAAERLAALDEIDGAELCRRTGTVLAALVDIMNAETTLLRAHRYKQAGELTAEKTQLAQDYVSLARSIQRRLPQLQVDAPAGVAELRLGHESLATQMAENLRVIATARNVTDRLLSDVASAVAVPTRTRTYGANGAMTPASARPAAHGIAVNRAL